MDQMAITESVTPRLLKLYEGTRFKVETSEHPRLYFTQEEIIEIRKLARSYRTGPFGKSGATMVNQIVDEANKYLNEKELIVTFFQGYRVAFKLPPEQPPRLENPPGFPATYGQYPYWTGLSESIKRRCEILTFAYALTGRKEYGQRAKEYVLSLARWDTWNDPSYDKGIGTYSGIDSANLTISAVTAYDVLHELFTETERQELREAIITKGLGPFAYDLLDLVPFEEKAILDLYPNGTTRRAAGLGIGALAILDEEPMAHLYLSLAIDYMMWFFEHMEATGDSEGMMYTSISTDILIQLADTMRRITGEDEAFKCTYISSSVPKASLYLRGGLRCRFDDSGNAAYFGLTMTMLSALGDPLAGWYLKDTKTTPSGIYGLIYHQPDVNIASIEYLPTSTVIPAFGWASLQSGWGSLSSTLAFKSNDAISGHTHLDQNSFTIFAQGQWLATDYGYSVLDGGPKATFTTNSVGHNTILVDGMGQTRRGGGNIERFMASPFYDVVSGEAAGAYGYIDLFRRRIAQSKFPMLDEKNFNSLGYLYVIYDELKADTPHSYQWLLQSDMRNMSIVDNSIIIKKAPGSLAATIISPSKEDITLEIQSYPGAEELGPYAVVTGPRATETEFLTLLHVAPYKMLPGTGKGPEVEAITHPHAAGLRVIRKEKGGDLDEVFLFRKSHSLGGTIDTHGISFDGYEAFIRHVGKDLWVYSSYQGKRLILGDEVLFSSDVPANICVGWEPGDKVVRISIQSSEPGKAKLHIPAQGWRFDRVNLVLEGLDPYGRTSPVEGWSLDAQVLTIEFQEGYREFMLRRR
jgi:hypothetical protein